MYEGFTITLVAATFLLAGIVKGVIGLGLPTVSLAILSIAINLPTAMTLLLVPSLVTNLWQALTGGDANLILTRIWPFLLMATVTVWIGATALVMIDFSWLSGLLGLVLIIYAGISLVGIRTTLTTRQASWVGPIAGAVNGILTGMTGSFVVPGVMYLQSIGFSRNQLVQSMGMLFTLSTLALAGALQGNSILSFQAGVLSTLAVIPAIIGMIIGQRVRQNLSEKKFRRVFFVSLLLLGVYIIFIAYNSISQGVPD
jgi:uncharacterized membrane protein YfcA